MASGEGRYGLLIIIRPQEFFGGGGGLQTTYIVSAHRETVTAHGVTVYVT